MSAASTSPAATAAAAAEQPLTTEQQIVDAFNAKRQQQQSIMQRIAELEGQIHEHTLVLDQLRALEDGRRCHRLVGGALIEKTVGAVRPEIDENLRKFHEMVKSLQDQLVERERDLEAFMAKYKISLKQNSAQKGPAAGAAAAAASAGADAASSAGVLA